MSQNFDLGPSFYFRLLNVKNSEKINLKKFYITLKITETCFSRDGSWNYSINLKVIGALLN